MSRYEEIAHEVAAEGTDAARAARDAILELTAEVATLWELVDTQAKHHEVLERTALLRDEAIAMTQEMESALRERVSLQAQAMADLKRTKAIQADLIEKQSEIIKRLMGKGVLRA